ncbi:MULTISPECIES: potassium channel family protein [unclassified Lentimonas]|uniref:potassium channel family protein n=1 Tax=unclassified Lentimonas TaxID=2630993 RepID=UPI001389605E|nr:MULTISPECIES: potassium channel family protein [unclassified Lentimonas]
MKHPIRNTIHQIADKTGKYTLFLICLLVTLILFPLVENESFGDICLNAWCLITMSSLAISLQDEKHNDKGSLYTGGFVFILIFISLINRILKSESGLKHYDLIDMILLPTVILFIVYVIWVILSSIFRKKQMGADELCGSIVAYILIGIAWALLYSFIELLQPNSFSFVSVTDGDLHAKGSALFYYSFVTLTTLGYGDILPVSQFARMVAYLEAVTGVMYTAILVAGLVGHIGSHKKEGN